MARGVSERHRTKEALIGGFLEEIMPKERYKSKEKVNPFQSQEIKMLELLCSRSFSIQSRQPLVIEKLEST